MMKTFTLITIFLAIFAVTTVQAAPQGKPAAGKKTTATVKKKPPEINNWISGELGLLAIGLRYERVLSPEFSIGGEAYWSSLVFIWNDGGIIAFGRFYPMEVFFVELGAGYNYHTGIGEYEYKIGPYTYKTKDWISTSGFVISPGLGWRIDPGDPGAFFVQPGIKIPVTLGTQKPIISDMFWDVESKFGVSVGVMVYCGLGYAF